MILSNITNVLSTFAFIPPTLISCKWQINIQIFTYVYSKICLYILFLERLFSVFIGSDLHFSKLQVYTARIYLFMLLLCYTVIIYTFSNGVYNGNTTLNGCYFNHPFWLCIIAAICDYTTITTILILFSRRLWVLSHRITGSHNSNMIITSISHISNVSNISTSMSGNTPIPLKNIDSETVESRSVHHVIQSSLQNISNKLTKLAKWNADGILLSVLRKTTILNMLTVISTMFTMLFCCFIFATLWISIDTMINCWMVLLMFKWYSGIYLFCCGKVSDKLSDECLSCCSCHCFCSFVTSPSIATNLVTNINAKITQIDENDNENA